MNRVNEDYNKALSYQHSDPAASLWRARKTAEAVCRQLYVRTIGPYPERLEFGKAITLLEEKGLPRHIEVPLRTIQHYGNLGTHSQEKETEYITSEYVQSCLDSLATVVTWYSRTYYQDETEKTAALENSMYVFISYHHHEPDSSLARDFADALKQAGHEAFIDTGIHWGTDWVKEIRKALEKANYLLLLLSKETVNSEMVLEEVAIARDLASKHNGIPIILPIRVSFPFTEGLPYQLELSLGTIQQETWNTSTDTSRLVKYLLTTIADRSRCPEHTSTESPSETLSPSKRPQPHFDPRNIMHPGGAIDVHSALYVERKADGEVFHAVKNPRSMVTTRGPRQIGKTSLMMRIYAAMQQRARVAFVDFQAFPFMFEDIQSLVLIWRAIVARIARQLQVKEWTNEDWNETIEYDENIVRFFEQAQAEQDGKPILICFDEVDLVFHAPTHIKSGFFASIRAFYNDGAMTDSVWRNVRWLLVTSSEPRFFIEDLSQSPFNIGRQIELSTFTPEEIAMFARRHGLTLHRDEIEEIMDYAGGHPYLVHLLFYYLMQNPTSHDSLFDARSVGGGIFRDHLHRYLIHFQQDKRLAKAMKDVIGGKGCEDAETASRLEAAGLVRWNECNALVPLCGLYEEFFRQELR